MINLTRPLKRKVTTTRGEPIVIALTSEGLYLREAGRRKSWLLPYGIAFQYAVQLKVDADRRAKAAERKAKQKTRRK